MLRSLDRPANDSELAAIMGISAGEASKRVKARGDAVRTVRDGRTVAISLPQRLH